MSINSEWHQKNRMPKNPTEKERLDWHIEHAKNCSCRPMPESLKQLIKSKQKS